MPKYPLNGKQFTTADDVAMIDDPGHWPNWPILPLKRDPFQVGTIHADYPHRVYLAGMFDGINADTPYEEFTSAQDVVDNGWRVD